LGSTARQVVSGPAPERPRSDARKQKRLKKRVVPKADGRYLIYYEPSSTRVSPHPAGSLRKRADLPARRGGQT